MAHFVKVEKECEHDECELFHIDTLVEASREICCEEDGDNCEPDVLPCMEKLDAESAWELINEKAQ